MFLAFLEIFVKFNAVSKRVKEVASFVGICPSPVESGSSVRGNGSIKREGTRMLDKYFLGKSLRKNLYPLNKKLRIVIKKERIVKPDIMVHWRKFNLFSKASNRASLSLF